MLFKYQMMMDARLFSKPSQLLPRIPVSVPGDLLREHRLTTAPNQESRGLGVADGGATGEGLRPRLAQPIGHLLHPSRSEHRADA